MATRYTDLNFPIYDVRLIPQGLNSGGLTTTYYYPNAYPTPYPSPYPTPYPNAYPKRNHKTLQLGGLDQLFSNLRGSKGVIAFKKSCAEYWNFLATGILSSEQFASIIMELNSANYTILHRALSTKEPEIVNETVNLIAEAYRQGILNHFAFASLLNTINGGGFSILHDALMIPNLEIFLKIFKLISEAYTKGIINKQQLRHLFCAKTKQGFTILHKALITANEEIVTELFSMLCKSYEVKILDIKSFSELLRSTTRAGFNIINDAIQSNQSVLVRKTLDLIRDACEEGILDKKEFEELLCYSTKGGFSILHSGLYQENPEIVREIVLFLIESHKQGFIHKNTLSRLLQGTTNLNFNLIHSGLTPANLEIACEVYYLIKEAYYVLKVINKDELESILCARNTAGNTILHEALMSKSHDIVNETFELIQEFYGTVISDEKIATLLFNSNNAGFNIVQEALFSGEMEIIHATFNLIHEFYDKKILDKDGLTALFFFRNDGNFSMLDSAIFSKNEVAIKMAFELIREACNEGAIDKNTLKRCLLEPTTNGFTFIHTALKTGAPQIVRIAFEWIREAHEKALIDEQTLRTLLCTINSDGFSILQQAWISGNIELVEETIRLFRLAFNGDSFKANKEFETLLLTPNHAGYNIVHHALISNNVEILALTFELLKRIPYTQLKKSQILISKTTEGYNPLHNAGRTDDIDMINIYLNFVGEVYGLEADKILQQLSLQKIKHYNRTPYSRNPAVEKLLKTARMGNYFQAQKNAKVNNSEQLAPSVKPKEPETLSTTNAAAASVKITYLDLSKLDKAHNFTPNNTDSITVGDLQESKENAENAACANNIESIEKVDFKHSEESRILESVNLNIIQGIDWDPKAIFNPGEKTELAAGRSWKGFILHGLVMDIIENFSLSSAQGATKIETRQYDRKLQDIKYKRAPEDRYNNIDIKLENNLREIKLFLNAGFQNALFELSVNQCSHLIDALNIPFRYILDNRTIATKVALGIFKELTRKYWDAINNNGINKSKFGFVLTQRSRDNFNILQQALISKEPEVVRETLSLIKQALGNKVIDNNGLAELLLRRNNSGFSIVDYAIMTNQIEIVKEIFNWIRDAYRKQVINQKELIGLFFTLNTEGFSVVHRALMSAQINVIIETFNFLREMPNLGKSNLVIMSNKINYNPLHYAASTNNLDIFNLYLNFVKMIYGSKNAELVFSNMSKRKSKWRGSVPYSQGNSEINDILAKFRGESKEEHKAHATDSIAGFAAARPKTTLVLADELPSALNERIEGVLIMFKAKPAKSVNDYLPNVVVHSNDKSPGPGSGDIGQATVVSAESSLFSAANRAGTDVNISIGQNITNKTLKPENKRNVKGSGKASWANIVKKSKGV